MGAACWPDAGAAHAGSAFVIVEGRPEMGGLLSELSLAEGQASKGTHVYVCGSRQLTRAVRAAAADGCPVRHQVHTINWG